MDSSVQNNPIIDQIHRTITASAAYIPARLVRRQLGKPEPGSIRGDVWRGSLLSADLSGFTHFSQQLSVLGKQGAEEVSAVINQLFAAMIAELSTYHGELLKFSGDELVAFFDQDILGDLHATAATRAALAMQERMESSFQSVPTRLGTFRLRLRIGVHSGRFFAAEVGDTSHVELVLTGSEVKCTALAQKIAAPGDVVISDATAQLLGDATTHLQQEGFWRILELPDISLSLPQCRTTPLLEITAETPETLAHLQAQEAALRPYLIRGMPRRFLETSGVEMGEFRPVTVLFVNFYDISSLFEYLCNDVETTVQVLNAYFCRLQEVVYRYDGIVNKVDLYPRGDRVMVLFGAPSAHEDDPQRAVRCAIDLERMLATANDAISTILHERGYSFPMQPLVQRIAINTGPVFAGRVGGEWRYEYTVMGATVNLASRLMEVAEDGTILLSPQTRSAVEHEVMMMDEQPLLLKGLTEPIVPARVLHLLDDLGKQHHHLLDPSTNVASEKPWLNRPTLVGRDAELDTLLQEATIALRGEGRVLAIVGEAGIGKTRIFDELARRLVMASTTTQETTGNGVPHFLIYSGDRDTYETTIPYSTIRATLRYLFGIRTNDFGLADSSLIESISVKVEHYAPQLARFMPLLSDVLGIALPETPLTQSMTPEQRHDRIKELVVALLVGAASFEPILLVFDDIHWSDVSSIELLAALAPESTHVPLLMVLLYRPGSHIVESWVNLPTTTRLALEELSSSHSVLLLETLLGGTPPPAVLPLLDRSQGNPLFIQEMVRELVSSRALARDEEGQWQLTRPLSQVAIPNSIEGLIISRLDQLDEECSELVQIASVIGYRFQVGILQGLFSDTDMLMSILQRLVEEAMIICDPNALEPTYAFRHALLRDVTYENILYSRRRELHRRVAQRIEERYPIRTREHLVLLAHHYVIAEEWQAAYQYHLEAAQQAQQRHANHEALSLFHAALAIAPNLQEQREHVLITLHESCGNLYLLTGECEKAEESFTMALESLNALRQRTGIWRKQDEQFITLPGPIADMNMRLHRLLATAVEQRDDYDLAFNFLARGIAWSTPETQKELARCYLLGAAIYQRRGEYEHSLEWARLGLAGAEKQESMTDQARALLLMGMCWREQGRYQSSIHALETAQTLFDRMKDPTNLSNVLNNLGETYYHCGRWRDAVRCYEQGLQISESIGDPRAKALVTRNLAVVMIGRGVLPLADELYTYCNEQFSRIGSVVGVAMTNLSRGEMLLMRKEPYGALQLFEESVATLERIKARTMLPPGLRLIAEALLALEGYTQARSYADRAIATASELGMVVEQAIAQRVVGQIAMKLGNFKEAQMMFRKSRTILESTDSRYELGKLLFWEGILAHTTGTIETSVGESLHVTLEHAQHIFKALGAKHDLALVRQFCTTLDQPTSHATT